MYLPVARHDGLTVRELPDETLVYDHQNHKAHCLNGTSAFVWKRCDGQTTLAELAAALHRELGLPPDEALVRLALEQLGHRGLLSGVAPDRLHGRRDVLRKLAAVAGALPVVMTLTAQRARAQASKLFPCVLQKVGPCQLSLAGSAPTPNTPCPTINQPAATACPGGKCDGKGNCVATKCPSGTCNTNADCASFQTCAGGTGSGCRGECVGGD